MLSVEWLAGVVMPAGELHSLTRLLWNPAEIGTMMPRQIQGGRVTPSAASSVTENDWPAATAGSQGWRWHNEPSTRLYRASASKRSARSVEYEQACRPRGWVQAAGVRDLLTRPDHEQSRLNRILFVGGQLLRPAHTLSHMGQVTQNLQECRGPVFSTVTS